MPLAAFISRCGRERLDRTCQRVSIATVPKSVFHGAPSSQRSSGVFGRTRQDRLRRILVHRSTASASHSISRASRARARRSTWNAIGHSSAASIGRFCVLMLAKCTRVGCGVNDPCSCFADFNRGVLRRCGCCVARALRCRRFRSFFGFFARRGRCAPTTKKPRRSGAGESLDQIFDRVQKAG